MIINSVVSIPVWDNTERQSEFTRNIVTQVLATTSDCLLVVVNNASPNPKTREFLDGVKDERFNVVHLEKNEGVSRGYNIGFLMGYALGAKYFIALNNDVLLHSSDWLDNLTRAVSENPRAIAGPRLIVGNRNVDIEGHTFRYIEGAIMVFSREFLDVCGVFDERFSPAYCEDVEICWRGEQNGFILREIVAPMLHVYGQTGYVSVPDHQRIATTVQNVRKLLDKANNGERQRIWYELTELLPVKEGANV